MQARKHAKNLSIWICKHTSMEACQAHTIWQNCCQQLATQRFNSSVTVSKIFKQSSNIQSTYLKRPVKEFILTYLRLMLYSYKCLFISVLVLMSHYLNPVQMGLFGATHGLGGLWAKMPPPPSLKSVTHPTMKKLCTDIPYLKKIQKVYKSHDTHLEFCWHQHFFTRNQQILLYQEMQI